MNLYIQRIAIQRSEIQRTRFMAEISLFPPECLVFVDETGFVSSSRTF